MRLFRGAVVFFVYFDGFVRFGGDKPRPRVVESHGEDSRLRVYGSRLCYGLMSLEIVSRPPVPEIHGPIVSPGN